MDLADQRKGLYGMALVVGLTSLLIAVPLYDIWADVATPPHKSLTSTVVENSFPIVLSLLLLGGTVSLRRRDWEGAEIYRAARWVGLAVLVATALMVWVIGIQFVWQHDLKPHVIAADAITVAALAGLAVGVYDVREKRRQRRLETERDHFSALYEQTTDAIATFERTDSGPVVTQTNQTFEDLFDRRPSAVLDAAELDGAGEDGDSPEKLTVETIEERVRNGDDFEREVRLPTNGGTADFRLRLVPTDGRYTYLVLTDITEQKERERFLQQRGEELEREKSKREAELEERTDQLEFLHSLLRHDVQNGMMVIRSRAEFIADNVDDRLADYADTIVSRSEDISEQIDRMRTTLETLTSDRWPTEPVELPAVLEERVTAADRSYPDAEIAVEGSVPDVAVEADEMLEDVLDNLIHNGVEHNDKDTPEVTATATERGQTVRIAIADNGPGVPDEMRDKVFRRGVSSAQESGDSGSGFGLFFVDTMVDAYDGEVWIEDNDPEGSRFVLELPKSASE